MRPRENIGILFEMKFHWKQGRKKAFSLLRLQIASRNRSSSNTVCVCIIKEKETEPTNSMPSVKPGSRHSNEVSETNNRLVVERERE